MAGFHAPIKTGNGVFFEPGTVGAGPEDRSANGYLLNRITNEKLHLWIYDFNSGFSATGMEAQSRMRREFFPRYFTQPRYLVKGQTPNQYEYQRLGQFIRKGMLGQVASIPNQTGTSLDAFTLRIEGRGYDRATRTTKGGHAGWTLQGYIEEAPAGGERFNFAPEYEFTLILSDATEGPMKVLDQTYRPQRINDVRGRYLASFGKQVPKPEATKIPISKRPVRGLESYADEPVKGGG